MTAGALDTDRLTLTAWSEGDGELLARLARLPAVVRFIGDGSRWTAGRAAEVSSRNLAHWREHGFGWRVARLRAGGEAVGLIALSYAGADSGIAADAHEIGWWLDPAYWGHGLAREGAAAVRDEAFTRVRAPSVVARIQPGNAASLAVAAAIGLTRGPDGHGRFGEPIAVLALSADDWRTRARRGGRA